MWVSNTLDNRFVDLETPAFDPAAVFNNPTRKPLAINPLKALFTLGLAFGLVGALIAGYIIGVEVFDVGITATGLYGAILMSQYLVQFCCAVSNRFNVDSIVRKAKLARERADDQSDCEKGLTGARSSALLNPNSEVSVAVVGYREDELAWRQCLRSLKTQTLRPKCVIGVVDGNDDADLSMANGFAHEFQLHNARVIHLPILLSKLHRDIYFATMPEDTRTFVVKFWHSLIGRERYGHEVALSLAKEAVIAKVQEWDKKWRIGDLDAVCFSTLR